MEHVAATPVKPVVKTNNYSKVNGLDLRVKTRASLNHNQQRLVLQHLNLAREIAYRYRQGKPRSVLLEDLTGAAMIGLCEAALRYDPSRGKFSTFAYRRILGACLDEMRRALGRGGVGYEQGRAALTDYPGDFDFSDAGHSQLNLENVVSVRQLLGCIAPSERVFIDELFHSSSDASHASSTGVSRNLTGKNRRKLIEKIKRTAA